MCGDLAVAASASRRRVLLDWVSLEVRAYCQVPPGHAALFQEAPGLRRRVTVLPRDQAVSQHQALRVT